MMNEIQLEATLRNIKMSEELKKSTDVYSIILIFLTMIVALVGAVQLIVSIEDSAHFWIGISLVVIMFIAIWLISRKLEKELITRYGDSKTK